MSNPQIPERRGEWMRELRRLSIEAGEAILGFYDAGNEVRYKADASPVTDADESASRLILAGLAEMAPDVAVVCEEAEEGRPAPTAEDTFFLVDPLDGTKEFISHNGEFTVNIALIQAGQPLAGVVYLPAQRRVFMGWHEGDGTRIATEERIPAAPKPIRVCAPAAEGLVVVASRSHRDAKTDEFLSTFKVKSFASAGSSLKFCLVAAGEADLYPRLGRTMEWDTAAGQAVLEAAGGNVHRLDGSPLRYGKPGLDNPFFVARGG